MRVRGNRGSSVAGITVGTGMEKRNTYLEAADVPHFPDQAGPVGIELRFW